MRITKVLIFLCLLMSAVLEMEAASIKNTLYSCDFLAADKSAGVTGTYATQTFDLNGGRWKAASAQHKSGEFVFGCGKTFNLADTYDHEFADFDDRWQDDFAGDVSKAKWVNAMELDMELRAVKSVAFRWSGATGNGNSNFHLLVYAQIGQCYKFLGTCLVSSTETEIVCPVAEAIDVQKIILVSVVTVADPRSLKLTECEVLGEDVESSQLTKPTFSVGCDVQIWPGTEVVISCPEIEGETICYSTDGEHYREAINEAKVVISESVTLSAYCKMKGEADSEMTTAEYRVFDINTHLDIAPDEYRPAGWPLGNIFNGSVRKVEDDEKGECIQLTNNTVQARRLSTEQVLMPAGRYKYAVDMTYDQVDREESVFSIEYAIGDATTYKKVAITSPSKSDGWSTLEGVIELKEPTAIRLVMALAPKVDALMNMWSVKVDNVRLTDENASTNPNAVSANRAAVRAWVQGRAIVVEASEGEQIAVYDAQGRMVKTLKAAAEGTTTIADLAEGGLYLVAVGEAKVAKVVVR